MNKLLTVICVILMVAAVVLLTLCIVLDNESEHLLTIALLCTVLANLLNLYVVRRKRKAKNND